MGKTKKSSHENYIGFNIDPNWKKEIIKKIDKEETSISDYCKKALLEFEHYKIQHDLLKEKYKKLKTNIIELMKEDKALLEFKNDILILLLK